MNSVSWFAKKSWVSRIYGDAKLERGSPGKESNEGAPISASTVASRVASAVASKGASTSQRLVSRPSVRLSCSPSKHYSSLVFLQHFCEMVLGSDLHLYCLRDFEISKE